MMAPGAVPHREHRLHPRLRVRHLEVLYRPDGFLSAIFSPDFKQKAVAIDLSEGGMKLISHEIIPTGTFLVLRLHGAFIPEDVVLHGRVTRCQQMKDRMKGREGHVQELGVALTKVVPDYLALLKRLKQDPLLSQGL